MYTYSEWIIIIIVIHRILTDSFKRHSFIQVGFLKREQSLDGVFNSF